SCLLVPAGPAAGPCPVLAVGSAGTPSRGRRFAPSMSWRAARVCSARASWAGAAGTWPGAGWGWSGSGRGRSLWRARVKRESCLRNWMAQADTDDAGDDAPKLTSKEKKELAELRREKRRLEMEVEILKRAAAYFARENVLPN